MKIGMPALDIQGYKPVKLHWTLMKNIGYIGLRPQLPAPGWPQYGSSFRQEIVLCLTAYIEEFLRESHTLKDVFIERRFEGASRW